MKLLCAPALLLLVSTTTLADSTLSQSTISSCTSSEKMVSKSRVVNPVSGRTYRTRITASHFIDSNGGGGGPWAYLDQTSTSWGGNTQATLTHTHQVGSPVNGRIIANHVYERCGNGFWTDWIDEESDRKGCGTDEA